jgi:hypothetical protein
LFTLSRSQLAGIALIVAGAEGSQSFAAIDIRQRNRQRALRSAADVQALRLFRATVELCSRCEAFAATILARSLFETVLGTGFLLNEDVRIIVEPILAGPKIGPPAVVGYQAKRRSKNTKRTREHKLSRTREASITPTLFSTASNVGRRSFGDLGGSFAKRNRL